MVLPHTEKKRHIDQWHRLESPERSLHIYGQLIDDKQGKKIQWRKIASSISGSGKTGELHVRILPNAIHKNKLKMD